MLCDAEPEKRLSLGERIPVKEELLLIHFLDHLEPSGGDRRSSRLPAQQGMLSILTVANVVGVWSIRFGYR